MFCEQCSQKLPEGSKFCGTCGAKQVDAHAPKTPAANSEEPVQVVSTPEPKPAQPIVTPPPVMAAPQQVTPPPVQPIKPTPQPQYVKPTPAPQQPYVQPQQASPIQPQYQTQPQYQGQAQPQYATPQGIGVPPLSVGEFLKMQFLLCIPIVNFVLLIIWSFDSSGNKNKRNYALAALLFMIILMAIGTLLTMLMGGMILSFLSDL